MYFSGFAILPEDGLQAAAAGGLRAAPPEVLNACNYDKKAHSASRKRRDITKKIFRWLEKQVVTSKIRNINRLMYGALFSVLFLQLFVVVVAPLAARVGYPLVVAVSSGVATTIYPGPVLFVATVAAGFATALATPRKHYGILVVMAIVAVVLATFLAYINTCYYCKTTLCSTYPVASCSASVGLLNAVIVCACQS
jgi:hypothetical protein